MSPPSHCEVCGTVMGHTPDKYLCPKCGRRHTMPNSNDEIEWHCIICNRPTPHISFPKAVGEWQIQCSICMKIIFSRATLCPTCKKQWYVPNGARCLWCEEIARARKLAESNGIIRQCSPPDIDTGIIRYREEGVEHIIKLQILKTSVYNLIDNLERHKIDIDLEEIKNILNQV
jgi:hypothetical protein